MQRNRCGEGCECHRERYNRWIEPCLLYLLWDQKKHGYELMSQLPQFGFLQGDVDPGAIYRTLRHLEEVGLVTSQWDTSGHGPAKRRYTISTLGKSHLQLWVQSLERRRDALNAFVDKLKIVIKNNTQKEGS